MFTTQTAFWLIGGLQLVTILGLWAGNRRQTRKSRPQPAANARDINQAVLRLEGLIETNQRTHLSILDDIRQDLAEMRGDIEWLASDRMIAEAIELARQNAKPAEISTEPNRVEESVRALKVLRRH